MMQNAYCCCVGIILWYKTDASILRFFAKQRNDTQLNIILFWLHLKYFVIIRKHNEAVVLI